MMLKFSLLAAMLATGSLGLAQTASTTLPKGFDTTPGASYVSAGFGIKTTWTVPVVLHDSRQLFLYDSSTFPWGAKAKIIDKISFRRSHLAPANNATAHTTKWVVIMSTSSQPAHRPNTRFEANHGPNKKTVFGASGPQNVVFLATPKPAAGKTAPFDVTVDITNFLVPPKTKTLVIEIRSIGSTVASGDWFADADLHSGTGYNGGSYKLYYSTHCIDPKSYYSTRANYLDGHLGHVWRTYRKAGLPVIGIAGTKLATGIKIPGTLCEWHVNPILFTAALTANGPAHATNKGEGAAYLDWGHIPSVPALIGVMVAHQAIIIDPTANTAGLGITRAGESSIGTLYDGKLVKISGIYSYGSRNNGYTATLDPNKETYARYLFRRAPIINIQ